MVNGDEYLQRITSVFSQFQLARRAIDGFLKSDEAVVRFLHEELEKLGQRLVQGAEKHNVALEGDSSFASDRFRMDLSIARAELPKRLEEVEQRLRQNEVILLIALFENEMKEIHREMLRQNPQLLKPDRQVSLGKLVSQGTKNVIESEIDRDVQSLDRKSVEERAHYFQNHLNLDWFNGKVTPLVRVAVDCRNRILHETPNTEVPDFELMTAQFVAFHLPLYCCLQGAAEYPSGFTMGEGWDVQGFKKKLQDLHASKKE